MHVYVYVFRVKRERELQIYTLSLSLFLTDSRAHLHAHTHMYKDKGIHIYYVLNSLDCPICAIYQLVKDIWRICDTPTENMFGYILCL